MGIYQGLKSHRSLTDLAIIGAVALFFFTGVVFESRRSNGTSESLAPDVGAIAVPSGGDPADSESETESENTSSSGVVATSTLTSPEFTPFTPGTPDPDAVGQPVFLDLSGIENESVIEASEVTIIGTTTPDALLSVNGQSVEVELDGSFRVSLSLDPGPNFIEIVSSNLRGQETSRVISVVSIQ